MTFLINGCINSEGFVRLILNGIGVSSQWARVRSDVP